MGGEVQEDRQWREVDDGEEGSGEKWMTERRGALKPVAHRCWAHLLHSEATLLRRG